MRYLRNGNLLKSRVSEICVKRIRVNYGVGVWLKIHSFNKFAKKYCGMGIKIWIIVKKCVPYTLSFVVTKLSGISSYKNK